MSEPSDTQPAANPVGRPTKYRPSMCQVALDLLSQGKSQDHICAKLDISEQTYYRWKKEIPEFSEAIKKGMPKSKSWHWDKRLDNITVHAYQAVGHEMQIKRQFGFTENPNVILPGFAEADGDLLAQSSLVLKEAGTGFLSLEQAEKFMSLVDKAMKIKHGEELESRLEAVELAQGIK